MVHTNMPRNCTVFLLPRRLARSAIYGSQIFDSQKWPNMLVRKVKGKPRNFEANVCGLLYSTFKTSFQSYAFYNKLLQTLYKDQLDRSKATCSFNINVANTIWLNQCNVQPETSCPKRAVRLAALRSIVRLQWAILCSMQPLIQIHDTKKKSS